MHRFGAPDLFPRLMNPGVILHVGHQHPQFWPIPARIVNYYSLFWGPRVISTIDEPRAAFTCRSSTPAVLADFGPFVDYYAPFWGPGLISTIDEPRGAFTCRSSTPAVLADSGPYRELLLTVLGS